MKTQNQPGIVQNMDKQALRTFGVLAFVIYSLALAYCYFTNHFLAVGIMAAVMLGLGILVVNIYSSIDSESKKHQIKNSFKQAA
jgi:hypothetical protein